MQTERASTRIAYSPSTVNVITAVFMVLFHIGAVAAFWFFSWTNVVVALVLHWLAVGFGISLGYHRLHTHRGFKTSKAVRVLPGRVRHVDARGRTDLLGRDPPRSPPALGPRRRSALAARRRVLGSHGLDPVRRLAPQQHAADGQVRAGPRRRSVLPLAELLPLGAAHDRRLHPAGGRRLGHGVLGHRSARRLRPARHLAGQLGHAHVGHPPLQHPGRLTQQLVGGAADVRRGLAQQPSRAPGLGASRAGLVRVRHQLDHAQAVPRARDRLGRQGREGSRACRSRRPRSEG